MIHQGDCLESVLQNTFPDWELTRSSEHSIHLTSLDGRRVDIACVDRRWNVLFYRLYSAVPQRRLPSADSYVRFVFDTPDEVYDWMTKNVPS